MKKIIKILVALFLCITGILIVIPIFFKDNLIDILKTQINKNINADVDFSDLSISLITNFPKAKLTLENISVINKTPFKGDTLFYAKEIALKMPMSAITKSADEIIEINSFTLENGLINIISNIDGSTNYDIAKKTNHKSNTTEKDNVGFSLSIQEYAITNTTINYIDKKKQLQLNLNNFNHNGSGGLLNNLSTLKTNTSSNISLYNEGVNYLNNNTIALKANLEIDQKNKKYSFLDNSFTINQLQLIFDGYIKQNNDNNEIDIKFFTPTTDFKNFLALLPAKYATDISSIKTKGTLGISGYAKGIQNENTIPKFSVNIISENASLKYPSLPKSIENININIALANTTGNPNDTYVNINPISLQIDKDKFSAEGKIAQLTRNTLVDMKLNGILNLGNVTQAYPIDIDSDLKGIFKANLHTIFSQKAIEKNIYEEIKTNGEFGISNFKFNSNEMVNPLYISEAKINFSPKIVSLNKLEAKSGESDINGSGTIENLMGTLFSDKNFKGKFNVNSNLFKVSDFMAIDTTTVKEIEIQKTPQKKETLKIPSFLDVNVTANAKKVIYDNLILQNVTGALIVKDETVTLSNIKTEVFDGSMKIQGNVSTKEVTPTFNVDLDINEFDINKSLNGMELLSSIAPVAKMFNGKLNTTLTLNGAINDEMELDLNSITGNALAEVLTTKISPKEGSAFSLLNNKLSFIDLDKLDFKDLRTALKFENGKVIIKPFNIKYNDINIQVAGSHSFTNELSYTTTFDVPAKYFGNQLNGALSKLNNDDIKDIKVPVIANINGTMSKPKITTNMKESVTNLTNELLQVQKNKLINQGTKTATNAIGNIISENKKSNDSTNTNNAIQNGVKDVIGGLFKRKKKE